MARCKHDSGNIQQFTEICLDCGHNIYETDEEYEVSLKKEIISLRKELGKERISKLEDERERLRKELSKDDDDNYGGW
jgi:hypothetical protein